MNKTRTGRTRTAPTRGVKALLSKEVLGRARQLVEQYTLVFEPIEGGAGFIGRAVEMPLVFSEGATIQDCLAGVRESLALAAATMMENGRIPPAPIREERGLQINVRVSSHEKMLLETTAQSYGFGSVSAFMRSAALMRAGPQIAPLQASLGR